ncbi:PTS sugar transporter subunit IIA [Rhabdochromatium marinum]|uniref:PTS sugar transporter subunit IIA n=1 Tax=Rhabdochromatium marinum TaxID=48729 RepID=UPI001906A801|nr:PTS sugar transporter subunit IIA [Rhabdochromatium marinum]MBK1647525.1 PTS sugar transporter subunit IIA [Rhabdochromatium marinum]
MFPPHFIVAPRVLGGASIRSKKRLLETLAELLVGELPALSRESVFDRLLERERLGSTGLGHGVALPHARMAEVTDPIGAFIQIREPVAFDAIDDQPVDLAFALLVPEAADETHLQLLSGLATLFDQDSLRQQLRGTEGSQALVDVLLEAAQRSQPPVATPL